MLPNDIYIYILLRKEIRLIRQSPEIRRSKKFRDVI